MENSRQAEKESKKYHIGMYGGKFLPFHLGHRYCVEFAAAECDIVYVILFYGGPEEEEILRANPAVWLSADERKRRVERLCFDLSERAAYGMKKAEIFPDGRGGQAPGADPDGWGEQASGADLNAQTEQVSGWNPSGWGEQASSSVLNSRSEQASGVDPDSRAEQVSGADLDGLGKRARIIPAFIDISKLRLPDGSEDWEAETPLVREICGDRLDAVYSSEPGYGEYFSHAYPEAVHRLVDVPRVHYPISGTAIRGFSDQQERNKWLV